MRALLSYCLQFSRINPAITVLLLSLAPLSLALLSQYGFGLFPCELCIYQRVPYVLLIVAMLAWSFTAQPKRPVWVLGVAGFMATALIAGFHMGVEYGWWEGLGGCTSQLDASSLDELRNQLLQAPASCKDPAFMLFGLSMAGWNALYGLGAALFCLYNCVTLQRKNI